MRTISQNSHRSEPKSMIKVLLTQAPFNRNKIGREVELTEKVSTHEVE